MPDSSGGNSIARFCSGMPPPGIRQGCRRCFEATDCLPSRDLPALQAMARDYLAIPATSAASERMFSQGRNLITWQRHRLGAERVRACMTLKSWIATHPGERLGGLAAQALTELGLELEEGI
ncbi:hypothetical protein CLOM_g16034 [Closterium sp. NIES-68]|nr:hypothetical protein CLOM_g16034 [Closterium sp. NIES-68]GJP85705.1 hypothetical protein CLOP_g15812 [Closterium sp. NIES-67]